MFKNLQTSSARRLAQHQNTYEYIVAFKSKITNDYAGYSFLDEKIAKREIRKLKNDGIYALLITKKWG